jgi:hypothetical protein
MGRFLSEGQAGNNHDMARRPVIGGEAVIYEGRGRGVRLEVRLEGETLWLTLNQMAELFERDKSVISRHLKNVFASRELSRKAVVAEDATTAADGKTYRVEYFNLDAILSVGYRVNSKRGTLDGRPLYPSVQARAAHLLYFLIKDHPFLDGNKRIGTLLFLEYLRRNGMLAREDGSLRLADNAMVALALLVAESDARHKDLMIRLTLSLLEDAAQ